MSEVPFQKRPYKFFVSYSHKNSSSVAELVRWINEVTGLRVWWDNNNLSGGDRIVSALPQAIKQSQMAILINSHESVDSGWVKEEYNVAISQRAKFKDYRIIVLKIDDAPVPDFLETTKWIEMPEGKLDVKAALGIFNALYPDNIINPARGSRDIYVSRSWKMHEAAPADAACLHFCKAGFRLVGDAEDQRVFDPNNRVRSIMSSCGALIALIPHRGGGQTSSFIMTEIKLAASLGLPYLLITDEKVFIEPDLIDKALEGKVFSLTEIQSDAQLGTYLVDVIQENYQQPISPHYAFYATSLRRGKDISKYVSDVVEMVTGIECIMGQNLNGRYAQQEIINRIRNSLFMLADISADNINSLVEAGVARGAGTPLILLESGEPHPTRFMFRDLEINFYNNPAELLGMVHKLVYPYRRRILNTEFTQV